MTDPIRTAIVGCGKVGRTHAEAYAALARSHLVGVCDVDLDRATAFGRDFGVPGFTDVVQMIRSTGAQMVSVCTPHPRHAEAVESAAHEGVHCLVEKPLAADLSACDRAIEACRMAHVKLGVVSQRRWYRPIVRMRNAIDNGSIGKPVLAVVEVLGWRSESYYQSDPWRGRWETEGGGVLVNQTPHQIDLLLSLMGPVEEIYGYWDNLNHPYIEVEDTAVAVIRFVSGALGTLVLSNSQNPGLHGTIHVHGSNGATIGARTEGGSSFVSGMTAAVDPPINDVWTVPGEEHLLDEWQKADIEAAGVEDPMTFYHARQLEEFLGAIAGGRSPAVEGEDGRRVVEVFTAIYRSRREHRPIRFPVRPVGSGIDYDGRLSRLDELSTS